MIPKFVYLETYGCSANLNNSEIIKGLIRQSGLDLTSNPKIADLLIINSCIVKEPTEKKIEARIKELSKLSKPLIITGCMPSVRKENLRKKNIYLLPSNNIKSILKLIRKIAENSYEEKDFFISNNEVKLNLAKVNEVKKIGITQILEGCLGNCSYCITKLAKGSLFSYPEEKILANIKKDLESGCKEIWLTSQDNAAYGLDKGKSQLIGLLQKIINLEGNFRIRLGMMNPNNVLPILDELVEIYKSEKIYKFLHLPLQSASNKILKEMNRKYKIEDFLPIIDKFKQEIPNITIATDIIAAYPTETEQDFQESLKLIEKIQPEVLNVSKFWHMSGTSAFKLKQLDKKTAKERADLLMKIYWDYIREKNKLLLNQESLSLVYDSFNNNYLARTPAYRLVLIKSNKNILGKLVKIKITGITQNHFLGELI